ncbi:MULTISPECIES: metal ABC transporter permease [Fusobacterium]|uniref:metal ABC transporter permease n=1 Tax=Fusobacterium TaxID=848 RepID=UPI0025C0AE6F|nr:metal ABC transporter permease [Fusobacterium sp.]MCI7223419.1 metal ABC transporter permease [Fusobacterium sp.]MDD7411338.1 metal ABC transporter permease [Fusobacteriaceae bacterium]MDY5305348.1 metal ABC transporter permease [Fusobacterium gastrosuis]MDY5713692.1 metal ABC transporter permease [Fusobacterium gastrosuis]
MFENFRIYIIALAEQGKIPESFKYGFVINAIICAILIGPILGGIGTMVVAKKMAFFSEAVGHAAMTGIAIGVILGEPFSAPYISLFTYCIVFGLLINYTKNRTKMASDTLIGVFLAMSIALGGSLLIYVSGKVNSHALESILFGSILTVNDNDIYILLITSIIIVIILIPFLNKMLLASFNPSLAIVRGVNVKLIEYIFIVIVTVITIASVKIVGSILVEALLLIPAASAKNLSKSIKSFVIYSIIFSLISCLLGIYMPIHFSISIPSGGAIILVASTIFIISIIIKMVFRQFSEGE